MRSWDSYGTFFVSARVLARYRLVVVLQKHVGMVVNFRRLLQQPSVYLIEIPRRGSRMKPKIAFCDCKSSILVHAKPRSHTHAREHLKKSALN